MRFFFNLFCVCFALIFLNGVTLSAQSDEAIKQGRALFQDGQYQAALDKFTEVLNGQPTNLEAQMGKMGALGGLRKRTELQGFAQKNADESSSGLTLAGYAQYWNRDLKNAEQSFQRAIAADNKNYMAHYMLAVIKKRARAYDPAISHLEKAIAANAAYPESYYLMGDIYREKGQIGEVIKFWNQYLDMIPRKGKRHDFVNSLLRKMGGH